MQKIFFQLIFWFWLSRLWTAYWLLYSWFSLLWSRRSRQTSSLDKDQTVKFGNNFRIFRYIEPNYELHVKENNYSKNS